MEALWNKVASEAGLVACILLLACAALWRELVKARSDYTTNLKESLNEKIEAVKNYLEFKHVLQATTHAIEEGNERLERQEARLVEILNQSKESERKFEELSKKFDDLSRRRHGN